MSTQQPWKKLNLAPSSNIDMAVYRSDSSTLRVRFAAGRVYEYANVPAELVTEWEGAESTGKFFSRSLRLDFESSRVDHLPELEDAPSCQEQARAVGGVL